MADRVFDSPADLDAASLQIIEAFECAWLSGPPEIPLFLERHPGRSARLLVELVAIDIENRIKRGQDVEVADYSCTFPEIAASPEAMSELAMVVLVMRQRARNSAKTFRGDSADAGDTPKPDSSVSSLSVMATDWIIGHSIGGATIVRLINEGGMGRVYEGYQQNPRRTVAVKVIKSDVLVPSMLRRFEYEANVLGRLHHPNIAQIYSAGTQAVGGRSLPYFVMEHIPGAMPITAYAAAHKLSLAARIDLLRVVCEAVGHGHRSGVVHRDLKPGNILVDQAGVPRVIDFGMARVIEADSNLTSMHTVQGAIVGTLQYMSPEQFDANPDAIAACSDVYSLGVVMHELVAGRPPLDLRDRSLVEIARVVREEDPPLATLRGIPRDLAIIMAKCLEKVPDRRYVDASALGDDLARHVRGESIAAKAPSLATIVVRRLQRHKVMASLCAGLLAVCVSGFGIAMFASRSEQANREASVATAEAAILTAIESISRDPLVGSEPFDRAQSLVTDLGSLSADRAEALRLKVREAFEERVAMAIDGAANGPAVRDHLVSALGRLEAIGSPRTAEYRARLSARDHEWIPSFKLESPYDGSLDSIASERVRVVDGLLGLAEGDGVPADGAESFLSSPSVLAKQEESGEIRCEVAFGESWRRVRQVGVEFRYEGGSRYLFLLREVAAAPGTSGAEPLPANDRSAVSWEMLIVRDQTILRRKAVGDVTSVPSGTLVLSAERRGDQLRIEIPTIEMEFLDIFSLPVEAPARVGVVLSAGVEIVRWKTFHRIATAGSSRMWAADDLYRRALYEQASQAYTEVVAASRDADTRREARYKQAIVDLRQHETTRAITLLERIRDDAGDRWAVLATAKLLELNARGVRGGMADNADLLGVLEIHALESGVSLAAIVPEDVRLSLVRALVPEASSAGGPRVGGFGFGETELKALQRSRQTLRILDPGSALYWQVMRSLYQTQLHAGNAKAARQLAMEMRDAGVESALLLTRAMREEGDFDTAIAIASRELAEPLCQNSSEYLVEQLYCLAAMERWAEWDSLAAAFVEKFHADIDSLRRDGLAALGPRAAIGRDYCLVQLMRGFRCGDLGQAAAAQEAWAEAALRSHDRVAPLAGSNRLQDIVRFLSGSATEGDSQRRLESFLRDNDHPLIKGAMLVIPKETVVSVLSHQWASARGRFIARSTAFDSLPYRQASALSQYLFFYEYCRQSLASGDFVPEEDELVWSLAVDGHAIQTGVDPMPYTLIYTLLLAWRSGRATTWIQSNDEQENEAATGGLVIDIRRIPESIRARFLYLYLMRYRSDRRIDDAEGLRRVIAAIDPDGIAGRLAVRGAGLPAKP